jgi:arginine deiminase
MYPNIVDSLSAFTIHRDGQGGVQDRRRGAVCGGRRGGDGIEKLRVIATGLDPVTAEREQWDDGNNTLALAPGVVVAYERNIGNQCAACRCGHRGAADRGLGAGHGPRRPTLHVLPGGPRPALAFAPK